MLNWEMRSERGEKACCFQPFPWFFFSLKMYLNSSQQGSGATNAVRLSFCHAAYGVSTNPCRSKIFAIKIEFQGIYLFIALFCISEYPCDSSFERKRHRKEQRVKEMIRISWFIKGCLFGFFFLQKESLSSKSNSLEDLKERDTIPLLFHSEALHLRLWFLDRFSFAATST